MKILHLVRGLANSSGTTHTVIPMAEEQARMGHDVRVWHVAKPGMASLEPNRALVGSRCFPMTVSSVHFGFSIPFAKAMVAEARRVDVVHIHAVWNFVTLWGMLCARWAGTPCIVAPQGSFDRYAWECGSSARRAYARMIEIPAINRTDCIQVLTKAEEEQARDMGIRTRCAIIPNGVQVPAARAERSGCGCHVVFIGRLDPKKGVDILLRAFAELAGRRPDARLTIAGDDGGSGYGERMRSLAEELGLTKTATFAGEVRGEDKFRLLVNADVFVLASHSEGLPVAVLEALAHSVPVVVTPGCHLPEVAETGAGEAAPPLAPAIGIAIEKLLTEPANGRARIAARSLVETRFAWPVVARRATQVYGELTGTAERRSRS